MGDKMLNSDLAQSIVEKMMEIIPYNVNIMDKNGVIIGSGDKGRINTKHSGAIEALKMGKPVEIFSEDENIKPGFNTPISFNAGIVGAIGITGEPEKVRAFGELVKVTAELLLNQEYSIQKHIVKTKIREEFIYEWIHRKDSYDRDFRERGLEVDIDIEFQGYVALFDYEKLQEQALRKAINKFIGRKDYSINIGSSKILLILREEKINREYALNRFIKENEELFNRVVTMEKDPILALSFYDVLKVINVANRINSKEKIITESDIIFFCNLENKVNNLDNKVLIDVLINEGKELIETFLVYIEFNYEVSKAAKELHIHRNTLSYRITKIEEITKLSFNDYMGRFRMTSAYIYYRLNSYGEKKQ